MAARRWVVVVTDWSKQQAFFGPYRSFDRARDLQKQVNARLAAGHDGFISAWASVEELEPSPGCKAIVEWALGEAG